MKQAALDPELAKQFDREAKLAFIEKLADEFLATGRYSLDRPDELIAALTARIKREPEAKP